MTTATATPTTAEQDITSELLLLERQAAASDMVAYRGLEQKAITKPLNAEDRQQLHKLMQNLQFPRDYFAAGVKTLTEAAKDDELLATYDASQAENERKRAEVRAEQQELAKQTRALEIEYRCLSSASARLSDERQQAIQFRTAHPREFHPDPLTAAAHKGPAMTREEVFSALRTLHASSTERTRHAGRIGTDY